ncbi:MAG: metal-dependent hydrolase [Candidatus Bathyarchaeota archaeon]|nr:metal-dependent hydrolase [Candidatus Bathyarchaeota archaeon]
MCPLVFLSTTRVAANVHLKLTLTLNSKVNLLFLVYGGRHLFAVGHMAIAYLLGKGSSKALHTQINIPIILVLSILPDIDIVFDFLFGVNIHRGPTHSVVVAALVFIPFFIHYGKKAIPYFLALISHSVIGDFFIAGQLQLFWPLSRARFGLHELGSYYIDIFSPVNLALEVSLFIVATIVLYKSRDWKVFFKPKTTHLMLIIPITTVLLPSTIGYPFSESLLITAPVLAFAHLFYLVLFSIAVLKTFVFLYRKCFGHQNAEIPQSGFQPKTI